MIKSARWSKPDFLPAFMLVLTFLVTSFATSGKK